MSRARNRIATVNWSSSRATPAVRFTVPSLGVASRFGSARAHRTSIALAISVPQPAAHHTRCVGAGCPSFGGQRTVWFASNRRSPRSCSTAISSLRPSSKTNSQQPGVRSVAPRSCRSLALRMRAAPGRLGRAGTGFARATTAGALGQRTRAAVVACGAVRPSNGASNWSVKRTHNGGPQLLAPSWSAAPLCAAYLQR
jgi:hypothetical protein